MSFTRRKDDCYENLKNLTYDKWEEAYRNFVNLRVAERGALTEVGINADRLKRIHGQFLTYVAAQYDPYTIAAEVAKAITAQKLYDSSLKDMGFKDGNRRMSYIYAIIILRACGIGLDLNPKDGAWFKANIRSMSVEAMASYIKKHSYDMATRVSAFRANNSASVSRNQASNSASDMDTDIGDAPINRHRRGFRRR